MLEVSPANFGVSGRVEFKEMKLEPVSDLKQLKLDADSPDGSPKAKLWDVADAFRIVTPTRETICLNGLWNFFPVSKAADAAAVPQTGTGWGWFKVPGIWPGMGWGDNQPGDNSAIVLSPFASAGFNPAKLNTAWYRRTVAVPADWKGRAVSLDISMLQTCAQVYVDGKRAGELYYPGGKVDLTAAIKPGTTQELALLVSAKNDEAVGSVFMARVSEQAISSKTCAGTLPHSLRKTDGSGRREHDCLRRKSPLPDDRFPVPHVQRRRRR